VIINLRDGKINPPNNLVATPNNLEILLVIKKLDKIYQKIGKNGLFLVRVLRKVVWCNDVNSFNHTVVAKDLLFM